MNVNGKNENYTRVRYTIRDTSKLYIFFFLRNPYYQVLGMYYGWMDGRGRWGSKLVAVSSFVHIILICRAWLIRSHADVPIFFRAFQRTNELRLMMSIFFCKLFLPCFFFFCGRDRDASSSNTIVFVYENHESPTNRFEINNYVLIINRYIQRHKPNDWLKIISFLRGRTIINDIKSYCAQKSVYGYNENKIQIKNT